MRHRCLGIVRTNIELADDLLRQARILAIQRGATLCDRVAAGLRAEWARAEAVPQALPLLPAIRLPADAPVLRKTLTQMGA